MTSSWRPDEALRRLVVEDSASGPAAAAAAGTVIAFATAAWIGAHREMAAIYSMIRSVELPVLHTHIPHVGAFSTETLRAGQALGLLPARHPRPLRGLRCVRTFHAEGQEGF